MNITEDFCSYEGAKLLKEKGFDEPCIRHWDCDDHSLYGYNDIPISNSELQANEYNGFSAPSQSMAMKWLREVHNKHCDIGYDIDLKWFFQIIDLKETVEYDYPETKYYHAENETGFNSYEETVEAAIKYCLEKIIK